MRKAGKEKSPRKKHKDGRERPHFFGFQPPKKSLGRSRPSSLYAVLSWPRIERCLRRRKYRNAEFA